MTKEFEIVIDFSKLEMELKKKRVRLIFFNNGHLLEDENGRLYQIETYWHGSYLDHLISEKVKVKFILSSMEHSPSRLFEYYDGGGTNGRMDQPAAAR